MNKRAFTMIELLCVVAVIAILAAISVPNFLEAQNRTKISKAHQDMDVLEAALLAYQADYNAYPPTLPHALRDMDKAWGLSPQLRQVTPVNPEALTRAAEASAPPKFENEGYLRWYSGMQGLEHRLLSGLALNVLTTPMPYLTMALPGDPFSFPRTPIGYVNLIEAREAYGVTSLPGSEEEDRRRYYLFSTGPDQATAPNPLTQDVTLYDPTNGSSSAGVIARFGGDVLRR